MQKNKLTSEQKRSIKIRTITAFVLIALILPCIILGNWFFVGISALILIGVGYETVHITQLKGATRKIAFWVMIVLLLVTCYYVFFRKFLNGYNAGEHFTFDNFVALNFTEMAISEMILMLSAAVLFIISFAREDFEIRYVFYFLSMIVILSLGVQSLLYLRFAPFVSFEAAGVDVKTDGFKHFHSLLLILYMILGVCVNDIGAFFTGLKFGKHKMAPRVSPKKTWEGAIGGVIISFAISFSFAMVMDAVGYPIFPVLNIEHWYYLLVISLLIPVIGDVGDFVFSAVKRSFNVKDYSTLLPGHGGIIDRLDSIIFAGGLVSGLVIFIQFMGNL